jgi:hypothetical protein
MYMYVLFFCIFFGGLECVGHSCTYVAHVRFVRDFWTRTQRAVVHCKEISIYVFPEKELRGLSPNFHIHVSVSNLYITPLGLPIFLQQNRQATNQGDI